MQAHHVRHPQQLLQGQIADVLLLQLGFTMGAGIDHLHAKGQRRPGHPLSDLAKADDAQGASIQLLQGRDLIGKVRAVDPVPRVDALVQLRHMAHGIQQQGKHMLHHGDGAVSGDIGNHHAPLLGGGNVDVVVPRGQLTQIAQRRAGLQHFPGNPALVGQHDLRALHAGNHLIRGRAVINRQFPQRAQQVPVQVLGMDGITIQNDNFHKGAPPSSFNANQNSQFMGVRA